MEMLPFDLELFGLDDVIHLQSERGILHIRLTEGKLNFSCQNRSAAEMLRTEIADKLSDRLRWCFAFSCVPPPERNRPGV